MHRFPNADIFAGRDTSPRAAGTNPGASGAERVQLLHSLTRLTRISHQVS
jgi:hypothetical protein